MKELLLPVASGPSPRAGLQWPGLGPTPRPEPITMTKASARKCSKSGSRNGTIRTTGSSSEMQILGPHPSPTRSEPAFQQALPVSHCTPKSEGLHCTLLFSSLGSSPLPASKMENLRASRKQSCSRSLCAQGFPVPCPPIPPAIIGLVSGGLSRGGDASKPRSPQVSAWVTLASHKSAPHAPQAPLGHSH